LLGVSLEEALEKLSKLGPAMVGASSLTSLELEITGDIVVISKMDWSMRE
jgi:hypothetical protein